MSWSEVADTNCSVARTLAVVGDRWTILILREMFLGTRRFDDLQAQTGMSPHLLSTRLKRLEQDAIIARHPYQERPVRHEYRLTEQGLDLYPVLLALKGWGEKWGGFAPDAEPALTIAHRGCGHAVGIAPRCAGCGETIGARDAVVALGDAFAAERRARRDAA
jgi:DNA-binding HxlR family transcriptional regulator